VLDHHQRREGRGDTETKKTTPGANDVAILYTDSLISYGFDSVVRFESAFDVLRGGRGFRDLTNKIFFVRISMKVRQTIKVW